MHRFVPLLCALLTILFVGGCFQDAPHDNPLDPQSPQYTGGGAFSGKVTLVNFPQAGIASVRISTLPSTLTIVSDSSGNYQFPEITAGTYEVIASKDSYSPDTVQTTIIAGKAQTISFALNGFPQVVSAKILTRKIDLWWPSPEYFADVTADVSDPNGVADLDSVWFTVDSVTFPMSYSLTDKNWQLTVTSYDLPSNNLEWLVGKSLTIVAKDRSGSLGVGDPFYVTRTIEQEAAPASPPIGDTTSGSPVFQWTAPDVRFVYTYSLSVVYVASGTETPVWSQDNIGNHLLSYQYPSTLPQGNYSWTIEVVDEYGNYARSKESSFVVK
ncbi:MAG TPA: carboxypeptidase-like regulatory domain-containing protein [Bacteroidota bacterium]|nr:carboxypeptidase-like regulatory domain-containing protein [Bacteroidota bacterium]